MIFKLSNVDFFVSLIAQRIRKQRNSKQRNKKQRKGKQRSI